MNDRPRHWMIVLQREYRARPITFAVDDDGNELVSQISPRRQVRESDARAKRPVKREATRTKKQRADNMRFAQRQLAELRRKIADPREIVVTDKTGLIEVPKPKRERKPKQKSGWKRRVSGLFVPGRDA